MLVEDYQEIYDGSPTNIQNFLKEDVLENIGSHVEVKKGKVQSEKLPHKLKLLHILSLYGNTKKETGDLEIPHVLAKIDWLLSKKVYIDERNKKGQTPLMLAGTFSNLYSSIEIVNHLLERGAKPNLKDKFGNTALMNVCGNSSSERSISTEDTVKLLLDKGADPNIKNKHGSTPLMISCEFSSPINGSSSELTVSLLLEGGADPNIEDEDVGNALLIAIAALTENGDGEMITSTEKTVKMLLEHRANPNITNSIGTTPLMISTICNLPEIINMLLDHGADINKVDNRGLTCLAKGIIYIEGCKKAVKLLIKRGADVNIQGMKGITQKHLDILNDIINSEKKWNIPKLINNDKTTLECGICLNHNRDKVINVCSHTLCSACTDELLSDKEEALCPICRKEFTIDNVYSFIL